MNRRDDQDVNARNRAFGRFEQVNKPQDYHLSEQVNAEQYDEAYRIQTCDLGRWLHGGRSERNAFSKQLGEALSGIGFAILTGHGIDPALFLRAEEETRAVFESTTEQQRLAFQARRYGSINQGYFPLRETTIIHPDLVLGWVFCRRAFDLDDDPGFDAAAFWPEARHEAVFRELVKAQEVLILPIMQSLLSFLGCDPHLWDERLTGTNFGLRLNYYPALTDVSNAGTGGRMLGHEDVDLFTLLPAPAEEGLQVLNRKNMRWIRLHAPPGSIILNTGDYMQRLSNDIFPSTTHRVARPRDPNALGRPRISFPMAVYTDEDTILEVLPGTGEPRYPPVRAIEFHTAITSKYYGASYAVSGDSSTDPD